MRDGRRRLGGREALEFWKRRLTPMEDGAPDPAGKLPRRKESIGDRPHREIGERSVEPLRIRGRTGKQEDEKDDPKEGPSHPMSLALVLASQT